MLVHTHYSIIRLQERRTRFFWENTTFSQGQDYHVGSHGRQAGSDSLRRVQGVRLQWNSGLGGRFPGPIHWVLLLGRDAIPHPKGMGMALLHEKGWVAPSIYRPWLKGGPQVW